MMRIAVIGGTGLVGGHTVQALTAAGHDAVSVARSTGVDVTTGDGLEAALTGADAVIDVSNTPATDTAQAQQFFTAATERLLAAEQRLAIGHHVLLSIVGIDLVQGNAHYAGKRRQEQILAAGPVPYTILRATQFFDFAAMVVSWTLADGCAVLPPLLIQPVAVADVAQTLVELATAVPQNQTIDLAGPQQQDLVDMARRTLTARGQQVTLMPSWRDGPLGVEMAGEVLLPGPQARIASTTFDSWLAAEAARCG